jgi:hypothetical protein
MQGDCKHGLANLVGLKALAVRDAGKAGRACYNRAEIF